jgi:hypothetical protein
MIPNMIERGRPLSVLQLRLFCRLLARDCLSLSVASCPTWRRGSQHTLAV